MNSIQLFLVETCLVAFVITILHRYRNYFGFGLLLIFLGSIQFYQTFLATAVYNEILPNIVVSPGSAILFTSSLCSILLIFHSAGFKKSLVVLFGILYSNVILAIISSITVKQVNIDNYSKNGTFIQELLNFDITMFLIGTLLFFIDFFLLIILYVYVYTTIQKAPFFFKLFIPLTITALVDSILYYSTNLIDLENGKDLLFSNIIGKQLAGFIITLIIYIYLKWQNLVTPKENLKNIQNILLSLTSSKQN